MSNFYPSAKPIREANTGGEAVTIDSPNTSTNMGWARLACFAGFGRIACECAILSSFKKRAVHFRDKARQRGSGYTLRTRTNLGNQEK